MEDIIDVTVELNPETGAVEVSRSSDNPHNIPRELFRAYNAAWIDVWELSEEIEVYLKSTDQKIIHMEPPVEHNCW